MSKHLQFEIENLKKSILYLGAVVEENVQKAVIAIESRDEKLAQNAIETDTEIDRNEVDLEEECLKVLALYQPVAGDLRFIISILKINNALERIGDLAVNIAERAFYLAKHERLEIPFNLSGMAEKVRAMLRQSLDAMVNADSKLAYEVCAADETVDEINRDAYNKVKIAIHEHLDQVDSLLALLSVSRYLERIADHATNIARDVIYMLEGEIVRHRVG